MEHSKVKLFALVNNPAQIFDDIRKNRKLIYSILFYLVIYIMISSLAILFFEHWSYQHSLYFTTINITSVGFGDVVPATYPGKVIAGINAFAGLIFFGFLIASITIAFQKDNSNTTVPYNEKNLAYSKSKFGAKGIEDELQAIVQSTISVLKIIGDNSKGGGQTINTCKGEGIIKVQISFEDIEKHNILIVVEIPE